MQCSRVTSGGVKNRVEKSNKDGGEFFGDVEDKIRFATEWSKVFDGDNVILDQRGRDIDSAGEVGLFRAVIMQALLDSVSNSKRTEDIVEKRKALEWFDINNNDFRHVCEMANLNCEWVLKKSSIAILNGCKWRNDKKKELNN